MSIDSGVLISRLSITHLIRRASSHDSLSCPSRHRLERTHNNISYDKPTTGLSAVRDSDSWRSFAWLALRRKERSSTNWEWLEKVVPIQDTCPHLSWDQQFFSSLVPLAPSSNNIHFELLVGGWQWSNQSMSWVGTAFSILQSFPIRTGSFFSLKHKSSKAVPRYIFQSLVWSVYQRSSERNGAAETSVATVQGIVGLWDQRRCVRCVIESGDEHLRVDAHNLLSKKTHGSLTLYPSFYYND